jgi:hypothetical protein
MMNKRHSALLRVKTLGKGGDARLLAAAKHNLREIPCLAAEAARSPLNQILRGPETATAVAELAQQRRTDFGFVRRRKDDTIAAEMIFSLPPQTRLDISSYFATCLDWVLRRHGPPVVLSAVVHRDEVAPHMHVLMLPVWNGTWMKSAVFGGRKELKALHDQFFSDVGFSFGLRRAPARQTPAQRGSTERAVVGALAADAAPCMQCSTWPVVRDLIAANPVPFAEVLGIEVSVSQRTMAQIFTSTGKGSRRERAAQNRGSATHQHLSCVGVGQEQQD